MPIASPSPQQSVDHVFSEALRHTTGPDRDAYLDAACAGDAELRQRVDRLLRAHGDAESFLELPAVDPAGTIDQPSPDHLGTQIGPYKLLQLIGEGGMGVVYMAEQQEPVQRRVALKIIKPGMDSRQVIARFEAERQALAMMDHVNIARVLDAGATEQGQPYFVMELVKGVPITKYCDEQRLTLRQRLELFVPICHAIQHAHQKGIIHRDVKPTNILVALYDGAAVPKVIDFGVAKATGPKLTEKTMFTGYGQLVGTLEYMSPEQAQFNQLDIDTRSDIYSLGVLLYELLTGTTPFDQSRLRTLAFDETLRIIREEEPPKPSTKLSACDTLPAIAANRNVEPARLRKLVRGELDWIVMKALEKDRSRRYETANGLAMDVQRYLADEPVQACPPSAGYRLRKFARRNRAALVTAAVITLAVLLAVGSFGWSLRDQAAQRAGAERGVEDALVEAATLRDQAALQVRDPAQRQATLAAALSAVKQAERLFPIGGSDALQQRLHEMHTELEEKERDARMVSRLEDIRLVEADLTSATGSGDQRVNTVLRLYVEAFRDYGIDLETLDVSEAGRLIGQRAIRLELVAALGNRAWIEYSVRLLQIADVADPDPEGLTCRMRYALAGGNRDALIRLAEEARVEALAPTTLADLGMALVQMGKADEGVRLLRRAQQQYPDNWWISRQLAMGLLKVNPPERSEALRYLNAAWALRPRNAQVCLDLGNVLLSLNRPDDAIAAYRKVIELNPDDPEAYTCLIDLLDHVGRADEADKVLRLAAEGRPERARTLSRIGLALVYKGLLDRAITTCREAVRLGRDTAEAQHNLGFVLLRKGAAEDADEAIAAFKEAIHLWQDPGFAVHSYYHLGELYEAKKLWDEAVTNFRTCVRMKPRDALYHNRLGIALRSSGLRDKAIAEYRAAINSDWAFTAAHAQLGQGALEALNKSMELRQGGDSFDWFFLAMAQWRLGHQKEARDWYDKAVEWMDKNAKDNEELIRFRAEAEELMGKETGIREQETEKK